MALPTLYLEGLTQRARRGPDQLNVYKLGLIESILKETIRGSDEQDPTRMRSAIQTALEVARWEIRHPRPPQ